MNATPHQQTSLRSEKPRKEESRSRESNRRRKQGHGARASSRRTKHSPDDVAKDIEYIIVIDDEKRRSHARERCSRSERPISSPRRKKQSSTSSSRRHKESKSHRERLNSPRKSCSDGKRGSRQRHKKGPKEAGERKPPKVRPVKKQESPTSPDADLVSPSKKSETDSRNDSKFSSPSKTSPSSTSLSISDHHLSVKTPPLNAELQRDVLHRSYSSNTSSSRASPWGGRGGHKRTDNDSHSMSRPVGMNCKGLSSLSATITPGNPLTVLYNDDSSEALSENSSILSGTSAGSFSALSSLASSYHVGSHFDLNSCASSRILPAVNLESQSSLGVDGQFPDCKSVSSCRSSICPSINDCLSRASTRLDVNPIQPGRRHSFSSVSDDDDDNSSITLSIDGSSSVCPSVNDCLNSGIASSDFLPPKPRRHDSGDSSSLFEIANAVY